MWKKNAKRWLLDCFAVERKWNTLRFFRMLLVIFHTKQLLSLKLSRSQYTPIFLPVFFGFDKFWKRNFNCDCFFFSQDLFPFTSSNSVKDRLWRLFMNNLSELGHHVLKQKLAIIKRICELPWISFFHLALQLCPYVFWKTESFYFVISESFIGE